MDHVGGKSNRDHIYCRRGPETLSDLICSRDFEAKLCDRRRRRWSVRERQEQTKAITMPALYPVRFEDCEGASAARIQSPQRRGILKYAVAVAHSAAARQSLGSES